MASHAKNVQKEGRACSEYKETNILIDSKALERG